MSQVKVQGNASGTGIFTIASPNSNNNQTLTLPDTTGEVVTTSSAAFNIGSGQLVKDASGNVGVGTSSPSTYANSQTPVLVAGTGNNFATMQGRTDGPSGATNGVSFGGSYSTNPINGARITLNAEGSAGQRGSISFWTKPTDDNTNQPTERARIDQSGNAIWNGTNTTTNNGNAGYIYKFFGGNNNLIMPMEVGIGDRYAILEFRQTGRTNSARASQISIGQNSANQGDVQVYSSGANADISGGVRLNNGATSWSAISDMRLKTVTGTYTNALQDLAKIQAIKFTWKHDQSNTPQVGVSAQSVELAVPEAISTSRNIATPDDETDYLAVRYTELIPLMIASIQEQQAIITSLTARIAALEGAAQ